ncbi:aldolase catalytic domain-containing protein [Candidatus Pacearchaeota archaeon]|nr:aldolase catalytic domain-containing protein [Candidatus Pacearchaeota archaeon]
MNKSNSKVQVLDCTIRDGGYVNNWHFDKKIVREVYRAISKSGVDIVEIGYRGTKENFDPNTYGTWRFTTEENLQEVLDGIKGPRVAIMGDYGKIKIDDFEEQENSMVDMVRLAAHKNQISEAINLLENIKEKGYETSLQAMGFTGYTPSEVNELRNTLKDSDIDYFYIADSYGSIFPNQLKSMFEPFLELENVKIGFHPHNSLQMAFANTLEAIRIGVDIVDGSIYGMGRGSGNLPIEGLIAYLQIQSKDRYNVVPILSIIDKYFVEMHKETPWGYQLPYMLSGMFKCHPNYAQDLVKRQEYTIEDIWKVMEVIEEIKPVGFNRSIIDNLIQKGVIGGLNGRVLPSYSYPAEENRMANNIQVPYIGRHAGRDFLILANGPSLSEYKTEVDAFIKKYNPVVLGTNYLADMFIPDYHAFNNKKRFTMYVETTNQNSKLLIGGNIPDEMILEYVKCDYETLYFRDSLEADFGIVNGIIQSNCRTISILSIAVAIVMGAERIFIVGMDGYKQVDSFMKNSVHFYKESNETEDFKMLMEKHNWNERLLNQIDNYLTSNNKDGVCILTPTSHKGFYKAIENIL